MSGLSPGTYCGSACYGSGVSGHPGQGSHVRRGPAAQDLTRLRVKSGLLYTDDAGTSLFDTTNLSTFFSKVGYAIDVMSEEGSIHAANHAIWICFAGIDTSRSAVCGVSSSRRSNSSVASTARAGCAMALACALI